MGMGIAESSLFPNGNIGYSTFVKLDTTAEGYCLQAVSGDAPFGVAGPMTHGMALAVGGVNLDDGLAGVAGGPAIKIYGVGSTKVPLRIGAAVAVGDRLVPDANGKGVPTTANAVKVGAIARQAGGPDTIIDVDVVRFDSSTI